MILEHALLPIVPGREQEFERAMEQAKAIIAAASGFRSLTVSRCVERPSLYLLLVEWERLEDHTQGFRASQAYDLWRNLLHEFYDPFPTVEHYERVESA